MNRFENITKPLMWFMALLLTAFVAGCGGSSSGSPAPSSAKAITAYSLAWIGGASGTLGATPGTAPGNINETLKTIAVSVPFGTDVTIMKATFTSTGASVTVDSVTQTSKTTVNDFTGSVAYKVTAVDSTWATYTVIVTPITVTSIAVTPTSFSIPAGATHQFMATATYSNSTTSDVTTNNSTPNATTIWTSAASGVASVGSFDTTGTPGLATGVAVGTSDITATLNGQTSTAALAVTAATGPVACTGTVSACVALGTAANYAVFSDSLIATGAGAAIITGDIGVGPGVTSTAFTGFTPTNVPATYATFAEVSGKAYAHDYAGSTPTVVNTASLDMGSAYGFAAGKTGAAACPGAGAFDGSTVLPTAVPAGVYACSGASGNVTIPTNFTLNGSATDVWVFQISGTLGQSAATTVHLTGGALPQNVFWQVGGAVSILANAHFEGILLGATTINMGHLTSINGRLLAHTGITLDTTTVTQPVP